jgi:hypothetical protein
VSAITEMTDVKEQRICVEFCFKLNKTASGTHQMLKEAFGEQALTLSNPIFLPPTYSPALIYFGREISWWITHNYPTV